MQAITVPDQLCEMPAVHPSPFSGSVAIRTRGRFAPSPSGNLHFGSLVAAVGSWLHARAQGGQWLVRMEDIDVQRSLPEIGRCIIKTLAAFGLESDETVIWQSERLPHYEAAFAKLKHAGAIYPCHCSRGDLASRQNIHPRDCLRLRGVKPAWRMRVRDDVIAFTDGVHGHFCQHLGRDVGDFVVRRADGEFTYQLAVVVDDAAQAISEVVRGADLLDSTPRQILLQRQLDLPTPDYCHLPLALDESGRKLSKQDQSQPVDADDPLPALRAALAFLGQRVPAGDRVDTVLTRAVKQFEHRMIPTTRMPNAALRKD